MDSNNHSELLDNTTQNEEQKQQNQNQQQTINSTISSTNNSVSLSRRNSEDGILRVWKEKDRNKSARQSAAVSPANSLPVSRRNSVIGFSSSSSRSPSASIVFPNFRDEIQLYEDEREILHMKDIIVETEKNDQQNTLNNVTLPEAGELNSSTDNCTLSQVELVDLPIHISISPNAASKSLARQPSDASSVSPPNLSREVSTSTNSTNLSIVQSTSLPTSPSTSFRVFSATPHEQSFLSNSQIDDSILKTDEIAVYNQKIHTIRSSIINLQAYISPSFPKLHKQESQLEKEFVLNEKQQKRRFCIKALYLFSFIYLLMEIPYIISNDWKIEYNYPSIIIRCALSLLTIVSTIVLKQDSLSNKWFDILLCAIMSLNGVFLCVMDGLRSFDVLEGSLKDGLLLSLITYYIFSFEILKLPFLLCIIQSSVVFVTYNAAYLIHYEATQIRYLILSDLFHLSRLIMFLAVSRRHEIQRRALYADEQIALLERKKAEKLLCSMLPIQVIKSFLNNIPFHVSGQATIGFVQIEFDTKSSLTHISPTDLMQRLHDTFKRIDAIVEVFNIRGITKIETVSKTYLLCAGLLERIDDHSAAMIDVCLEILYMMQSRSALTHQRIPIQLRIGIATGSVVGGVIGTSRKFFRIFGDTVNTSSRMCTTTRLGTIQISPATYESLTHRQKQTYRIPPPVTLNIKGKGQMKCYHVPIRPDWIPSFTKAVLHRGLNQSESNVQTLNQSFIYHRMIQQSKVNKYTLQFESEVDKTVEQKYQQKYASELQKSSPRVHTALAVVAAGMMVWVMLSRETTTADHPVLLALLIGIFGVHAVVSSTKIYVTYLNHILFGAVIALSTWLVLIECFWTLTGPISPAFAFLAIINYCCFVLHLHWLQLIITLTTTAVAFMIAVFVKLEQYDDIVIVSVNILLCLIVCCYFTFNTESSHRFHFLLQYALQCEQQRMDVFLENLLPPFVVDVLKKKKGKVETEQQSQQSNDKKEVAETSTQPSPPLPSRSVSPPSTKSTIRTLDLQSSTGLSASRFAMHFPLTTVFESDIVGYTAMVSDWTAEATLNMLNEIFLQFDAVATQHGVEKIETIGDAFMAVVFEGQPDPILDFSLSIIDTLNKYNIGRAVPVLIRAGISTGSTFGGVIGTTVPRFHIFGPAHDQAIQIEQQGQPQKIYVSQATHQATKTMYKYAATEVIVENEKCYELVGRVSDKILSWFDLN